MNDFIIKEVHNQDIVSEISSVGYDSSYAPVAANKFRYKNLKIFNLTPPQANILKQLALSVGAECATHREVITCKIEKSSCLLGGSLSQLGKIADKLKAQPFRLRELSENLQKIIRIRQTNSKTKILGILNITENSFSDGGRFLDFNSAVKHLNELINDGADIIDIGAESTKPNSTPVEPDVQLERLLPVLDYIKNNNIETPISIDTRSAEVALRCIEKGADIINDVSGFDFDSQMPEVLAQNPHVKIIIQHSKGTPENMQNLPAYENLADEIYKSLYDKVNYAVSKGIKIENIIIDPGIGFGKTAEHNFEILRRWKELKTTGCPILIGVSRKSLLKMPDAANEEKDIYSLALNSILISGGIDYIRVHNVKIHRKLIDMLN